VTSLKDSSRRQQQQQQHRSSSFPSLCASGFILKLNEIIFKLQHEPSATKELKISMIHLYVYDPGLNLLPLIDWETKKT